MLDKRTQYIKVMIFWEPIQLSNIRGIRSYETCCTKYAQRALSLSTPCTLRLHWDTVACCWINWYSMHSDVCSLNVLCCFQTPLFTALLPIAVTLCLFGKSYVQICNVTQYFIYGLCHLWKSFICIPVQFAFAGAVTREQRQITH